MTVWPEKTGKKLTDGSSDPEGAVCVSSHLGATAITAPSVTKASGKGGNYISYPDGTVEYDDLGSAGNRPVSGTLTESDTHKVSDGLLESAAANLDLKLSAIIPLPVPTLAEVVVAAAIGQDGYSWSISNDQPGQTDHVVVATSAADPNAAQIAAGNDGSNVAATHSVLGATSVVGTNVLTATGELVAGTQYKVHAVARNANAVAGSLLRSTAFTTAAAPVGLFAQIAAYRTDRTLTGPQVSLPFKNPLFDSETGISFNVGARTYTMTDGASVSRWDLTDWSAVQANAAHEWQIVDSLLRASPGGKGHSANLNGMIDPQGLINLLRCDVIGPCNGRGPTYPIYHRAGTTLQIDGCYVAGWKYDGFKPRSGYFKRSCLDLNVPIHKVPVVWSSGGTYAIGDVVVQATADINKQHLYVRKPANIGTNPSPNFAGKVGSTEWSYVNPHADAFVFDHQMNDVFDFEDVYINWDPTDRTTWLDTYWIDEGYATGFDAGGLALAVDTTGMYLRQGTNDIFRMGGAGTATNELVSSLRFIHQADDSFSGNPANNQFAPYTAGQPKPAFTDGFMQLVPSGSVFEGGPSGSKTSAWSNVKNFAGVAIAAP